MGIQGMLLKEILWFYHLFHGFINAAFKHQLLLQHSSEK